MELKVKDFAAMQGVSESIIYRHIRKHKEALGDRVIKRGNATWLSDEGQAYIRDLMNQQPIVLGDADARREYEDLLAENRELLKALNLAKDKIIEASSMQMRLEAAERETKLLEGFIQDAKTEIKTLTEEKAMEAAAATRARQEASEALLRAEQAERDKEAAIRQAALVAGELDAYKALPWWKKIFG